MQYHGIDVDSNVWLLQIFNPVWKNQYLILLDSIHIVSSRN